MMQKPDLGSVFILTFQLSKWRYVIIQSKLHTYLALFTVVVADNEQLSISILEHLTSQSSEYDMSYISYVLVQLHG